ncbi:hypothetical protein BDW22DRAFT_1484188 [Trametopsis cervina]|nr:hypothetical protein BDW22DRAFT_1484188 [Trametopsis cervina]
MSNRIQAGNLRLRSLGSGSGLSSQQKAAAPRVGTREEQRELEDIAAARALVRPQRQAMLNAKEKAVWLSDATKKVRAGAKHARDRSPSPAPSKKPKGKAVAAKQRIRSTAANPTEDTMDDMQVPETRRQPPPAKKSKKSKKPTRPQPAADEVNTAEMFDDMDDDEPLPPTQRATYRRNDDYDEEPLPSTQHTTYHGDDDNDNGELPPPPQFTMYYGDDDNEDELLPPTQRATYYGDDDDDLLPPTQRTTYYGDDDGELLPPTQRTTYQGNDDDETPSDNGDAAESEVAPPGDDDDDNDTVSQAIDTDAEREEIDEGLASRINKAHSAMPVWQSRQPVREDDDEDDNLPHSDIILADDSDDELRDALIHGVAGQKVSRASVKTGERSRAPAEPEKRSRVPIETGKKPRGPVEAGKKPRGPIETERKPRGPGETGKRPRGPGETGKRPQEPLESKKKPRTYLEAEKKPRAPVKTQDKPRAPAGTPPEEDKDLEYASRAMTARHKKIKAEAPTWSTSQQSAKGSQTKPTSTRHSQESKSKPASMSRGSQQAVRERDVMIIPDSEEEGTGSQTVDSGWPSGTHIVISAVGNLLLTSSAVDVQNLFKSSMLALERHLIFTDAYPDSNSQQKFSFIRKFLTHEAKAQAPWIYDRLKQDPEYIKVLVESLETRISLFRNKFKTAASARTVGNYSLAGPKCAEYVEELLTRKRYIYPGDIKKGKFETSKPYEHTIFIEIISAILRSDRKHTLLSRHQDFFSVTWQGETNKEIPKAFLALVATAIHAALCDAKFKNAKRAKFTAEEFSAVYETHVSVLTRLEEIRPRGYHHLMEQLYNQAVDTSIDGDGGSGADDIFEELDLDGMDAN